MPEGHIRAVEADDLEGVAACLDEAVGPGFFTPSDFDARLSFVYVGKDRIGGVLTASLARYGEICAFYRHQSRLPGFDIDPAPSLVGHIREIAVIPELRRRGIAASLLQAGEEACAREGAEVLIANAWVRADTSQTPGGDLLHACGYRQLGEIPNFFRYIVLPEGRVCPGCHEAPCSCTVRVMLKDRRGR